jgi:pyruvate formate lyase activating enzyme
VLEIQRHAIHDGPGIRTVVFFKGCPLRCVWCHNPESLDPRPQIGHVAARCIACGACTRACTRGAIRLAAAGGIAIDRAACARCGSCVEECVADAMRRIGRERTVSEVLQAVLRDREFYDRSGGGLTLSGGEPFLQHRFAAELLRTAKRACLHTVVETCGHFRWEDVEAALADVDLLYFDLKVIDGAKHREYTGVGNRRIHANARRLAASDTPVVFRCPLVPGYTATSENIRALIRFLRDLAQDVVHLLPYHPLGEGKLARAGNPLAPLGLDPMSHEVARTIANRFDAAGLRTVLGGS